MFYGSILLFPKVPYISLPIKSTSTKTRAKDFLKPIHKFIPTPFVPLRIIFSINVYKKGTSRNTIGILTFFHVTHFRSLKFGRRGETVTGSRRIYIWWRQACARWPHRLHRWASWPARWETPPARPCGRRSLRGTSSCVSSHSCWSPCDGLCPSKISSLISSQSTSGRKVFIFVKIMKYIYFLHNLFSHESFTKFSILTLSLSFFFFSFFTELEVCVPSLSLTILPLFELCLDMSSSMWTLEEVTLVLSSLAVLLL